MKYYRFLNLPKNPLNPLHQEFVLKPAVPTLNWASSPPWRVFHNDLDQLISLEMLEIFKYLDLTPTVMLLFSIEHDVSFENAYIHRDITYTGSKWVDVPFSINFELNPSTNSEIRWWDTTCATEYMTEGQEQNVLLKHFNAIRYHPDRSSSNPKNLNNLPVLEMLSLKGNTCPILFRTDVAHSVNRFTTVGIRYNVSIRFDTNQVSSFDAAVEKLKHLIIESPAYQ